MQLTEIFSGVGEESFRDLLRSVSMGKLKTYQLFDRVKTRAHLAKLNSENLRKTASRLWTRVREGDQEFASDIAQAILVSHLDMIRAVLEFLEIPNEEGFFAKDADASKHLTEGWQQRVWEKFRDTYPRPLLLFYINHLTWEVSNEAPVFQPAA